MALGIGVGAWFGSYMTGMYADFFHFPTVPFRIEPALVAIAAGSLHRRRFGGALFAIHRVIELSPAQAMRPPAPPRYRRLLLERLGVARLIPTAARMILRNLERRPVRSVLAAVGVGAAVALIISGTFWWDAIGYMIDVQFNAAERSDAVITLIEPRSRAVGFEVASLPGVMQTEPYRTVGVAIAVGAACLSDRDHGARRAHRACAACSIMRQRPVEMPPEGSCCPTGSRSGWTCGRATSCRSSRSRARASSATFEWSASSTTCSP